MCLFETSKKNDQPSGKMTPEGEEENSIKVRKGIIHIKIVNMAYIKVFFN